MVSPALFVELVLLIIGTAAAPDPVPQESVIETVGSDVNPLPPSIKSTPSISPDAPTITFPAAPLPPEPKIFTKGDPH
jgi:hypothetical protein